jgi:electron transport complex protein RnfB
MEIVSAVILASVFVVIVGLILGLIIGFTAKIFAVEVDPRVEDVEGTLPGANCGGCGFAGCADFAKAIVAGDVSPDTCPVCASDAIAKIGDILGLSVGGKEKQVAVILCGGSNSDAKQAAQYNGVNDCKAATIVNNGPKGCKYGCLGLGSCARACPFDAIEIKDGLAIVHPELCVGCGKCVDTCPKNLIVLAPESAKAHVYCSSPEKGPAKKKVCSVSCIGCRKCFKAAEEGQIEMKGFLAKVNYENPPAIDIIEKAACPTGCLRTADDENAKTEKKGAE